MRSLVILVPVAMAVGFIPFGTLLEETVGSGPLFLVAMILYVVLFPLSPVIMGAILYRKEEDPAIGPITGATSFSYAPEANNETDKPELAEWWKPDMTENDGYQ